MNEQKAPISECPHCHSHAGFYVKTRISGYGEFRHNYDGSEAENGEFYANLKHKESVYTYCIDCEKRLFKTEEIGG